MFDFHDGSCLSQSRLIRDFFHGQNRAAWHVEGVENGHHFHLGHGHGPLLDFREDVVQFI